MVVNRRDFLKSSSIALLGIVLPHPGDKDRLGNSQLAQMNALFDDGDAEVIDVRLDERRQAVHTVTIGIRLDHRHHFCRGHMSANCLQVFS